MTTDSLYLDAFRGYFSGIMQWSMLTQFWQTLLSYNDGKWFVYAPSDEVPSTPLSIDDFRQFVTQADTLLHSQHTERYCGIVYVDNIDAPTFIKIYDPKNLGVSCGFSDNPPLPKWIISRLKPVHLDENKKTPSRWKQFLHKFV